MLFRSCRLEKNDRVFLEDAATKMHLSARAYHRILKLSRTIADLDQSDWIAQKHLKEALSYTARTAKSVVMV